MADAPIQEIKTEVTTEATTIAGKVKAFAVKYKLHALIAAVSLVVGHFV
jgi:hypothetical protein